MSLATAEDLRVDVGGAPMCDGLSFTVRGPRALVIGAPRAIFEAAARQRPVARGRLDTGTSVAAARALPPTWSALEYVVWSARLAGLTKDDARREAGAALAAFAVEDRKIARLEEMARRGVAIAGALATRAPVLLLDDPLDGLPEDVARAHATRIVAAVPSFVVFAPRVPLTSPLALEADDAVVLRAGRLLAQGKPLDLASAGRRFVAEVEGQADRVATLAALVAARGGRFEAHTATAMTLDLGDLTTGELFGLVRDAGVVLLELVPFGHVIA